ncbi:MAG: DinB family protein [Blastocatellia bacterium]|nr:DinB family protein [Blastocatellia bacterium]
MKVEMFKQEFERLHKTLAEVLKTVPEERLYSKPFNSPNFLKILSIGELIIHAAQIQEYLFNGLSANYWDHPHEWSSRESIPEKEKILLYLDEVEQMRTRTFTWMKDEDINKKVYLPDRTAVTIGDLFVRALIHMSHHRGQVYAYIHLFSDAHLPPISEEGVDYKRLI